MYLKENNEIVKRYVKQILTENTISDITPLWNKIIEKYGEEKISQLQFKARQVHSDLIDEIEFQKWLMEYVLNSVNDLLEEYEVT